MSINHYTEDFISYDASFAYENYKLKSPMPVYCPEFALQAVSVAKSYFDNNDTQGVANFVYSQTNFMTYSTGGQIRDSSGKGLIDCSCFINLVLRGIRYDNSPYANTSISTYNRTDLQPAAEYPWAFDYSNCLTDVTMEGDTHVSSLVFLRTAADLAEYFYKAGRMVATGDNYRDIIKPGDIIFYGNIDNDRFCGIHHIGIVTDNTNYYYHVSSSRTTDQVVFRSRIEHDERPERYLSFVARPFYENSINIPYNYRYNYIDIPWTIHEETVDNNVIARPDINSGTIWTGTGSSAANGNRQIYLKSGEGNRVLLSPGKYRLTGAPLHLDRRINPTVNRWGLRLYSPNNSSDIIPYTAFTIPESSEGYQGEITSTYISDSHRVWDRGLGAEFTLASEKTVCIDIFIHNYPVSDGGSRYSNTDTTKDIWRPMLIRIGDA